MCHRRSDGAHSLCQNHIDSSRRNRDAGDESGASDVNDETGERRVANREAVGSTVGDADRGDESEIGGALDEES